MGTVAEKNADVSSDDLPRSERVAPEPSRWNVFGRLRLLYRLLREQAQSQSRLVDAVAGMTEAARGGASRADIEALHARVDDLVLKFLDLHKGFGRLDQDLVQGLARSDAAASDVGANLANMWGTLSELTKSFAEMGATVTAVSARLDEATAATDGDALHRLEAQQSRTDETLSQLAQRVEGMQHAFLELHGGFGRLDSDLVKGLARQDAALGELTRRVASTFDEFANLRATITATSERLQTNLDSLAFAALLDADPGRSCRAVCGGGRSRLPGLRRTRLSRHV